LSVEAATLDRRAGEDLRQAPPAPALSMRAVVAIGARAGLGAGVAMIGWEMTAAEISREPTAIAGIGSSTWTPLTAIAAFLLGPDAFGASFAIGPLVLGLVVHLAVATLVGVAGVAALVYVLGYRPSPFGAGLCGAAYGLFLEVVVLNLAVNALQSPEVVYRAAPPWTWWVAHGTYGIALGLLAQRGLGRGASGG
jgi:hypothetical protein